MNKPKIYRVGKCVLLPSGGYKLSGWKIAPLRGDQKPWTIEQLRKIANKAQPDFPDARRGRIVLPRARAEDPRG